MPLSHPYKTIRHNYGRLIKTMSAVKGRNGTRPKKTTRKTGRKWPAKVMQNSDALDLDPMFLSPLTQRK